MAFGSSSFGSSGFSGGSAAIGGIGSGVSLKDLQAIIEYRDRIVELGSAITTNIDQVLKKYETISNDGIIKGANLTRTYSEVTEKYIQIKKQVEEIVEKLKNHLTELVESSREMDIEHASGLKNLTDQITGKTSGGNTTPSPQPQPAPQPQPQPQPTPTPGDDSVPNPGDDGGKDEKPGDPNPGDDGGKDPNPGDEGGKDPNPGDGGKDPNPGDPKPGDPIPGYPDPRRPYPPYPGPQPTPYPGPQPRPYPPYPGPQPTQPPIIIRPEPGRPTPGIPVVPVVPGVPTPGVPTPGTPGTPGVPTPGTTPGIGGGANTPLDGGLGTTTSDVLDTKASSDDFAKAMGLETSTDSLSTDGLDATFDSGEGILDATGDGLAAPDMTLPGAPGKQSNLKGAGFAGLAAGASLFGVGALMKKGEEDQEEDEIVEEEEIQARSSFDDISF